MKKVLVINFLLLLCASVYAQQRDTTEYTQQKVMRKNRFRNPISAFYNKSDYGQGAGILFPIRSASLMRSRSTKQFLSSVELAGNYEVFAFNYSFDPEMDKFFPHPTAADPLQVRFLTGEMLSFNFGASLSFNFFNRVNAYARLGLGPVQHHYIENVYMLEFVALKNYSTPVFEYNLYYYNQGKERVFAPSYEFGAYVVAYKNIGVILSLKYLKVPTILTIDKMRSYKVGVCVGFR